MFRPYMWAIFRLWFNLFSEIWSKNDIGNKEFLCITHTVEHNYISPRSTVGIQLHVSALYVWAIFRLWFNLFSEIWSKNDIGNKEFLCITHTVKHNYISPSSTVGIQLHVSALYVDHFQVVIWLTERLYKMCGGFFEGIGGWVGEERDLVVSIVGTVTWGCYEWIIVSCLYTYVKVGYYFFWGCHSRCVGSITKNYFVLYLQSNTTIFYLAIQ